MTSERTVVIEENNLIAEALVDTYKSFLLLFYPKIGLREQFLKVLNKEGLWVD